MELKDISTKQLLEELDTRQGQKSLWVDPYDKYTINIEGEEKVSDIGPCLIYIVID